MTDPLQMLHDIPHLAAEVAATRDHPNPSDRTERKQRTVPGPKPPTDLAMLHACMEGEAGGLRAELITCVRLVVEEMLDALPTAEVPDWPADTWDAICQWLTDAHHWWVLQPWAGDVEASVERCWRQLRALTRPVLRRWLCPDCREPMQWQDGDYFTCPTGHEHPGPLELERQWRRRPRATIGDIITRFRDELEITLTKNQIWQWHHRGKLRSAGKKGREQTFLPWDVLCCIYPDLTDALDGRVDVAS